MPDINVGNQLFDLAFHPQKDAVCAATVAGEVKCFAYDSDGAAEEKFALRVTKKSCRGLAYNTGGDSLYCVTKEGDLQ